MRARLVSDIVAVALSVVVVTGLGYVLRPQHSATVKVESSEVAVDRPGLAEGTRKTMLFIGDSYVAGTGIDETTYGCMAAARMGWYCKVSAAPGTGYISGGPANRFKLDYIGESTSFNERVPGLALEYQPDVVVLDGGRNDLFAPTSAVYAAIVSTIADVRRTWPAATVVVIRPRFLSRPADNLGYDDNFFDQLRAEDIAQHMVVFADPVGRLAGSDTDTSGMVGTDQIHPTREGELVMASALYSTLTDLGFVPAT